MKPGQTMKLVMGLKKTLAMSCLAGLGAISGCDVVKEDVAPSNFKVQIDLVGKATSETTSLVTFSNKPAVINMAYVMGGLDLRAEATASPQFGNLEPIAGGKYLLYTPKTGLVGNEEQMTLSLVDQNNVEVDELNFSAKVADPSSCHGTSGVYDYAVIRAGETLVMDLLDNDIFCNIGYNGGIIGTVDVPGFKSEGLNVILGPGRLARLEYTPQPGFTGKVKVIYNLGINWLNSPAGGNPDEVFANPKKYLQAFTTALVEIDVVP